MSWKVLSSKSLFRSGFFNLRVDECELPDGRIMPRYHVIEFLDWVNVIAVTPTGDAILVRQYRHAAGLDCLEIPGGSMDPGELPEAAGLRELREETGYEPGELISCGHHFPNPALQNNRMHTYLALNCRMVAEPELDPFEDLETVTMPVREYYDRWLAGEITHSIISASLARAFNPLRQRGIL